MYVYVYTRVASVAATAINNNAPESSTLSARDRNERKKEGRGGVKEQRDSTCRQLEIATLPSLKHDGLTVHHRADHLKGCGARGKVSSAPRKLITGHEKGNVTC